VAAVQGRGVARGNHPQGSRSLELIFAYIDPGSGSLVIQALIAGLVAIPIFFRSRISRLVRALRGQGQEAGSVTSTDDGRREA